MNQAWERVSERDLLLDSVQAVYLHGKLPCSPEELIFSRSQYARGSLSHQPLYSFFEREYVTHPTIFLGTSMDEPLLDQYIEARKLRPSGTPEHRPRSFLITRTISEADKELLEGYNIIPVPATTAQFLDWLQRHKSTLPSKQEILFNSHPQLEELVNLRLIEKHRSSVLEFGLYFNRVSTVPSDSSRTSKYLLGAEPTWDDIHNDLDAPRDITPDFQDLLEEKLQASGLSIIALLGHAGSGKSTILKRIGVYLAQAGHQVFFTNSSSLPRPSEITKALLSLDRRIFLLFDNTEVVLRMLRGMARQMSGLPKPPIIVIAAPTNHFYRMKGKFEDDVDFEQIDVSNKLSRGEIVNVINVLDDNDLLGYLKGFTPAERVYQFEEMAKHQILVAMRQATSGRDFDEIMYNEFADLRPRTAQLMCLCVALATTHGYRITIEEYVGCVGEDLPPAVALNYLEKHLRDVLLFTGAQENLISVRHSLIAEKYVESSLKVDDGLVLLRTAYIRLLSVLSSRIKRSHYTSRVFQLYTSLIRHGSIYRRFKRNLVEVRKVYESLKPTFHDDYHYWLQYGNLELEADSLELAENYLNQARSINPNSRFAVTALGHLELRKAIIAESSSDSFWHLEEGKTILQKQIEDIGSDDPHCYHIYCSQVYNWLRQKSLEDSYKTEQLAMLLGVIRDGTRLHPFNRRLEKLEDVLKRAHMYMAIPSENRPDDPIYGFDWDS